MKFGKLNILELRDAWVNEAADFTPFLAENIQVLGGVLGLDLELKEQEARVGKFCCDLHAIDLATNRTVIVENQLESTDHSHLGQLLTYAAGLEATVIVWVAKEIRDEHRAALDWLNKNTAAGVDFFAVIPKVFKIDESLPTFEFSLVVSPNDWGKKVIDYEPIDDRNSKSSKYKAFFQSLIDCARDKGFRGLRRALPQSWIRFATTYADVGLYVSFSKNSRIKVELYLEARVKDTNKHRYDQLILERDAIDKLFDGKLSWERLDDKIGCRVAIYRDASIDSSTEDLEVLIPIILTDMMMLRDRLMPYVQNVIEA